MALLFWDASALSKRYTEESGFETVDALFAGADSHGMASTPWGYVETYSILLRRLNGGVLDQATFNSAVTLLRNEVVEDPVFNLMSISDTILFSSISVIFRHNLNSTDAAILTLLLEFSQATDAPTCVLIASDKRLLRAAESEGFLTLNPEIVAASDVPAFLAGLD